MFLFDVFLRNLNKYYLSILKSIVGIISTIFLLSSSALAEVCLPNVDDIAGEYVKEGYTYFTCEPGMSGDFVIDASNKKLNAFICGEGNGLQFNIVTVPIPPVTLFMDDLGGTVDNVSVNVSEGSNLSINCDCNYKIVFKSTEKELVGGVEKIAIDYLNSNSSQ